MDEISMFSLSFEDGIKANILIFSVATSFLVARTCVLFRERYKMNNWVQVEATIEELEQAKAPNVSVFPFCPYVSFKYKFTFNGNDYFGTKINVHTPTLKKTSVAAYEILSEIEKNRNCGDLIHIWMNPSNPNESIFDKEVNNMILAGYVATALFCLALTIWHASHLQ